MKWSVKKGSVQLDTPDEQEEAHVPVVTEAVSVEDEDLSALLELKITIHRLLLDKINLEALAMIDNQRVRTEVRQAVIALIDNEPTLLSSFEKQQISDEVLDEVFGSLDIDRRRNLMEMLQRLMEENKAFQQLFVISHVDDVRAGAMFDEVWRVSETTEGVSQLEQVSVTGALEDY